MRTAIRTKQLTDLIRKNAASLQTVKIFVFGNWIKSGKWVSEVALPRLQKLETEFETDLRFVVRNSPLLEDVDLFSIGSVANCKLLTDDHLAPLSELTNVKHLLVHIPHTHVTASGILSLLKGKSRNSLHLVDVSVLGFDDEDAIEIEIELDAIEESTGRRPVVNQDPEYLDKSDASDSINLYFENESNY